MKRTTITAAVSAVAIGAVVGVASVRLTAGPVGRTDGTGARQSKQTQSEGYWRAVQLGSGRSEFVPGPWHWSQPAPAGSPQVAEGSRYKINDATGRH